MSGVPTHQFSLTRELQQVEAATLTPASLTHTRAIGDPTVSVVFTLAPASLTHTRAIGAAAVVPKLAPTSIIHTRAMGAPSADDGGGGGGAGSGATNSVETNFLTLVGF